MADIKLQISKPRTSPKWAQYRNVGFTHEKQRSSENKRKPVAWA
ncbi:hypothetical protein [Neisseria sicca]|nr:hypothetical protein [Neisseria sicca]